MTHRSVLVIGGGPVGLIAALLLSRYGISVTLVERDPGPTRHPKARGLTVRTVEIFRSLGLEEAILHYELPPEAGRFIWVKSFTGEEVARVSARTPKDRLYSPVSHALVAQNWVEQVLYERLQEARDAQILHHTEAIQVSQSVDGVKATLKHIETGETQTVQADYLIAADGAYSPIRQALGISMEGPDNLGHYCNVFCRADLTPWVAQRPAAGFFFATPELMRHFLFSVDGKSLWLFGTRFFPEDGQTPEGFTAEHCVALLRNAIGVPDLEVEVLNTAFWTMAAQVAHTFRSDRIFLAGDAAHRLPPTGGMGMNTGIQDSFNLAWKIAAVERGWADASLLDTYTDERMPIAHTNIAWSVENADCLHAIYEAVQRGDDRQIKAAIQEQQKQQLQRPGIDLGAAYDQGALIPDGTPAPEQYTPSARPGARAPHVILLKAGKEISTLDLFTGSFVLLVAAHGDAWLSAMAQLSLPADFPLQHFRISSSGDLIDPEHDWRKTYGIQPDGAVLVRPDGYVAWRSGTIVEKPQEVLAQVFSQLLGA